MWSQRTLHLSSPWVSHCRRGSRGVRVRLLVKCVWAKVTFKIFFIIKNEAESEPGQDSPFWTLGTGGCIKSLKGPRASFRAELTSDEEHVMHSTSVGYKAIT